MYPGPQRGRTSGSPLEPPTPAAEESRDLSELYSREVLTGTFSPFRTRQRSVCSPRFAQPGGSRSQAVLGTQPTATVTSCSFPVLPRAGESIFPPLGQPELPFPRPGEIAQRLRATA